MRSNRQIVEATFHTPIGLPPALLNLGHRFLEKGKPTGQVQLDRTVAYNIPVDMIKVGLGESAPGWIKSITFHYKDK